MHDEDDTRKFNATLQSPRKVVVAGGGPAGLAAALAVASSGRGVVLLDRGEDEDEGFGIQIAPNGGDALRRLGIRVEDVVEAVIPERLRVRAPATGNVLANLPVGKLFRPKRPPWIVCRRRNLRNALLEAVKREPLIELREQTAALSFDEREEKVLVDALSPTTEESISAALLVIADGVRSPLRRRIDRRADPKPSVAEREKRQVVLRAMLPRPDDKQNEISLQLEYGAHLVSYPVSRDRLNVAACITLKRDDPLTEKNQFRDEDAQFLVERAFARAAPSSVAMARDAAKAVKRGDARLRRYGGVRSFKAKPKSRVVVVGDAAHAMPPHIAQGASLAFEDACALAEEIRDTERADHDVSRRLAARRRGRILRARIATGAARRLYQLNPPAATLRDAVLRATRFFTD